MVDATELQEAEALFKNLVTNQAAGLVLPLISEKIPTTVQKGSQCSVKNFHSHGYYVGTVIDPQIKACIDELHSLMTKKNCKVGNRQKSTVVFNTMTNNQTELLDKFRDKFGIHKSSRIDEGRNMLKITDLGHSKNDKRRKELMEIIGNHLQKTIVDELKVEIPEEIPKGSGMTLALLETQPPITFETSVDGEVVTKVDMVNEFNLLIYSFIFVFIHINRCQLNSCIVMFVTLIISIAHRICLLV